MVDRQGNRSPILTVATPETHLAFFPSLLLVHMIGCRYTYIRISVTLLTVSANEASSISSATDGSRRLAHSVTDRSKMNATRKREAARRTFNTSSNSEARPELLIQAARWFWRSFVPGAAIERQRVGVRVGDAVVQLREVNARKKSLKDRAAQFSGRKGGTKRKIWVGKEEKERKRRKRREEEKKKEGVRTCPTPSGWALNPRQP